MTINPTKVDARVSTKDPKTCDASTMTINPTKVDACVSTEDPRTWLWCVLPTHRQRPGWTAVVLRKRSMTWTCDEKPEVPGTRGVAGGLKEIGRRHDAQPEKRCSANMEICGGTCHPFVRWLWVQTASLSSIANLPQPRNTNRGTADQWVQPPLQHSKWIKNYTTHDTHGQKKSTQEKGVTWNPSPSQIQYGKKTYKTIPICLIICG